MKHWGQILNLSPSFTSLFSIQKNSFILKNMFAFLKPCDIILIGKSRQKIVRRKALWQKGEEELKKIK